MWPCPLINSCQWFEGMCCYWQYGSTTYSSKVLIPVRHNLGTNCCVDVISHTCWQKLYLPVFIHWKILLMLTAAVSPCWPTDHHIQDIQNTVPFVAWGTMVAQWLRHCATNRKVAGSIPAGVIGFFIDIKSFQSHCGPGVDSACNRNEKQEHFLGVKVVGT